MGTTQPRSCGRGWLLAVVLIVASACATNPVTGKREFSLLSESQEIQIGQEADAEVRREMGVYEDRGLQEYVEEIGMRLARASHRPTLPWHFTVVDAAAVNAFALPGGYIYLTRGILTHLNDESELAGVLGHEIGHVTARHGAQAYTRAMGAELGLGVGGIFVPGVRPFSGLASTGLGLLFLKHGRDDELQADRLGAEYASQTGWDPSGVPQLLTTLARLSEGSDRRGVPNWLSTHPEPESRATQIQDTVTHFRAQQTTATVNRDGYLRQIDGLTFGENPREGVVRGATFLHPDLGFALQFPPGWEVTNSPTQVVAQQPGEQVFMVLQLVENPCGRTIEEIAQGEMREVRYREIEGSRTRINGLDAYVGTFDGESRDLGPVTTRVAHIIVGGTQVYRVAGLAPQELFARNAGEFEPAIHSFRTLSAAEADDIRPNRIDLYVVREGDTWQRIAQRAGEENVTAAKLAIMNGYPPNEQPRQSERIKIVVAG